MSKLTIFLLATVAALPSVAGAQAIPDAAPVAEGEAEGDIVVFGQGQTRQVQEISPEAIQILTPGSSPLLAIAKLPSVNVQSADPFGAYEWSTRITIRGFNQNQLGFNLDGIPLGDMTYGNHNGLHISRAISPENIGRTIVSQGAGSITTQSTNNLGGTLEFFTADPKDVLGVEASATYGSSQTMRGFARIGLGTADGVRGFISAHYHKANKWKGEGEQRTMMVNAKAVLPVGFGEFDAYVSYSDRAEQDYQDLSFAMINRLGYDWDNFGPSNYALAVRVADIAANRGETGTVRLNPGAGTVYPAPYATADDAYYDASGLRKDWLASLGLMAPLDDSVTLRIKGYYHTNVGQGTWGTPYVNSPTGVPMALRTTEYDINRKGVFASLSGDFGIHQLTIGGWYEVNDFTQARRFYGYESRTSPGRDHLKFQTSPILTQWEIDFNTQTWQYYVENAFTLGEAKLNLGWKGFQVINSASAILLGGRTVGSLNARDWFQPHAGFSLGVGSGFEAFAGFTSVTRAYISSTTSGPFSSTQAGFDAIKPSLKPEKSDTYEAGVRYSSGGYRGVLAAYLVNFKNRLLTIPTSVGIVGSANALQNVGGVRSAGIEATGEYDFGNGLSLFGSYSYNDNSYRDDVRIVVGGVTTVIPTAGKTVVDSPKHLIHGEVAFDKNGIFGRLAVNYMSKRFFTYTNGLLTTADGRGSVPGRAIVDAALGYRFDLGWRKPLEVQVNASNLLNKRYISTIGSNGFGNSGDNQTFLAAAPRQVFVTLKTGF